MVLFVMKMLPILIRKINGKKIDNKNAIKPGYSKVCIERALKIQEHDGAIIGLCGSVERIDKELELQHMENREDFNRMFDKIDEIKKE